MTPVCRVYSQLLQLFPGGQFAQVVKQHQAEFNAKGFTRWEQFVAMLFCQMTHMNSLREVCVAWPVANRRSSIWASTPCRL